MSKEPEPVVFEGAVQHALLAVRSRALQEEAGGELALIEIILTPVPGPADLPIAPHRSRGRLLPAPEEPAGKVAKIGARESSAGQREMLQIPHRPTERNACAEHADATGDLVEQLA